MKFLLYSNFDESSIRDAFGKPEHSYYFVLKAFRPVLERLGSVAVIQNPVAEADKAFEICAANGEACVLICFAPPHRVPLGLKCPTVVVLAWEFSTIPDGAWSNDPHDDWRYIFRTLGHAISLSTFSASVIKEAMGDSFPAVPIPAPVWNRLNASGRINGGEPFTASRHLRFRGTVFDSRVLGLVPGSPIDHLPETWPPERASPLSSRPTPRYRLAVTKRHLLEWYREAVSDLLPEAARRLVSRLLHRANKLYRGLLERRVTRPVSIPPAASAAVAVSIEPPPPPVSDIDLELSGVVYTTVFNPADGRKNWTDILMGFVWALRDREDATLVMKIAGTGSVKCANHMLWLMAGLGPFKCRVLIVIAYLEQSAYNALIDATNFYVNTSTAEGMCIPLVEFMTAGKPAIAPGHTAMNDYVDELGAFVVASNAEHNVWPHDPRQLFTTMRQRINWESVFAAYRESYSVAKNDPTRYATMARHASKSIERYCSDHVVMEKLRSFLEIVLKKPSGHMLAQPNVTRAGGHDDLHTGLREPEPEAT